MAETALETVMWPHQARGVSETLEAQNAGYNRVCLTSPTGGGKTRIMCELIDHWLSNGLRVAVYTDRRMLIDQITTVMHKTGFDFGVRAAGHEPQQEFPLQISSVQTENARVFKSAKWSLHNADRVLVDEAHKMTGEVVQKILTTHMEEDGAKVVGVTATPLGVGSTYDKLIVAGTNSELRACGALVKCYHYGPDEPDLRHIGKVQLGQDLTEKQNVKAMMTPTIFARVWEWWQKLNPRRLPTILFAPGVAESIWFAEQFVANGISAAHIDGQEVWVNGDVERTSRDARDRVLEGSKDGSIKVICNRFVLREGVDAPWLAHGIFATVFGSLQSYLQAGGRLLRAYPGLESVTLQDHGGNWWRHGSLNADREWRLDYTNAMVAGMREDRMRQKREAEPVLCPNCKQVLNRPVCACGWECKSSTKSRPVIQANGDLKEMHGDIFRPRRINQNPLAHKLWERMYWRAKKSGMTFRQAEALFAMENNWGWPDRQMPLMPKNELDWFRKVEDVAKESLK